MKILIFGANGRLGLELFRRLVNEHHTVIGIGRSKVDVSSSVYVQTIIEINSPDVVINCTAMNGLEACQKDPISSIRVNTLAPADMADICKKRAALFIHFSTDYVFSGDMLGLYENTPTRPWGIYGKTKLWGEEAIAMCVGPHLIFRLSSLYGRDFSGVLQPIQQTREGKGSSDNPVKVLHQFCAPTSTRTVAGAIAYILHEFDLDQLKRASGVYHLATKPHKLGESGVSKLEFTKHLLAAYYGRGTWHVAEGRLPEPRPIYSVLKVNKFEETFNYDLPNWRESLADMLPLLPKPEDKATVDPSRAAE